MKTTALSTALGLFPSAIKSGEPWTQTCENALFEARAELTAISTIDPAKPGTFAVDDTLLAQAIEHAVNAEGWDAKLSTPDFKLAEALMPRVRDWLLGKTDIQVYDAMTPQERAEAFAAPV